MAINHTDSGKPLASGPQYPRTDENLINNCNQEKFKTSSWSSGVMDIAGDWGICCCGTFCLPCLSCQVAVDAKEGCCLPLWWLWPISLIRTRVRSLYGIEEGESVCKDICCSIFCLPCVVCQLKRHLKNNEWPLKK